MLVRTIIWDSGLCLPPSDWSILRIATPSPPDDKGSPIGLWWKLTPPPAPPPLRFFKMVALRAIVFLKRSLWAATLDIASTGSSTLTRSIEKKRWTMEQMETLDVFFFIILTNYICFNDSSQGSCSNVFIININGGRPRQWLWLWCCWRW